MSARKVYSAMASSFNAYLNCIASNNTEWEDRHRESIEKLVRGEFPHGSGFDTGTKFDFDNSKPNKLIFNTEFHHMDEYGSYNGWTEHKVIVTPSLLFGFDIKITGVNKNDIKDYILEQFNYILEREVIWDNEKNNYELVPDLINPNDPKLLVAKSRLKAYLTPDYNLGSFENGFWNLLLKADGNNLEQFKTGFPYEVEAINIYRKGDFEAL